MATLCPKFRPGRIVIATIVLASLGCVTRELREVDAARAAYDACVFERSASDPKCEALQIRVLDVERRYEENARRAWSCDPHTEECPTPR